MTTKITDIVPCDGLRDALHRTALAAVAVREYEAASNAAQPLAAAQTALALNAAEVVRFGGPAWVGDAALAVARGEGYDAGAAGDRTVATLYASAVEAHRTERLRLGREPAWSPRQFPARVP